jgi:pyrroline-5-carboxylate reductase
LMANAAFPQKILIFGCGNMAGAILHGWIAAGVDPGCFVVVKPTRNNLPAGVTYYQNAHEVAGTFDVALLGIKPQMLAELAPQIAPLLDAQATLISILAGVKCDVLSVRFPAAQIVRMMPNLAVAIGKSPLGFWAPDFDLAGRAALDSWFAPLGTPLWLDTESQMNAFAALAGCGPAFIYRFIDALGIAGSAIGLPPSMAEKLALSMAEGAALLAAQASENPADLAARVASPGGMTAAGLSMLDSENRLNTIMIDTLRAAKDRGEEMENMGKKP